MSPALASLAIYSPGGKGLPAAQELLKDLPIVTVDLRGEGPTITAALTAQDLQRILPLLADAKVWVVQAGR
jgi:hypothetical protein